MASCISQYLSVSVTGLVGYNNDYVLPFLYSFNFYPTTIQFFCKEVA